MSTTTMMPVSTSSGHGHSATGALPSGGCGCREPVTQGVGDHRRREVVHGGHLGVPLRSDPLGEGMQAALLISTSIGLLGATCSMRYLTHREPGENPDTAPRSEWSSGRRILGLRSNGRRTTGELGPVARRPPGRPVGGALDLPRRDGVESPRSTLSRLRPVPCRRRRSVPCLRRSCSRRMRGRRRPPRLPRDVPCVRAG